MALVILTISILGLIASLTMKTDLRDPFSSEHIMKRIYMSEALEQKQHRYIIISTIGIIVSLTVYIYRAKIEGIRK